MSQKKHTFLYNNSLAIVVLVLMIISLTGQFITGWKEKNGELTERNQQQITLGEYASTGHFLQATFENWESEFLQMALYVLLTVFLRQKGSSESKKLDEKEDVDREPRVHPDSPWPVKKGGIWLRLYSHSLSITFTILFVISFILHFIGSLRDHNDEQIYRMLPTKTWNSYIGDSRFWFESFQNWQSEFLSIAAIVLLTIWLREKGSPESKPVDASHEETGR
jgi:hypothetical protein